MNQGGEMNLILTSQDATDGESPLCFMQHLPETLFLENGFYQVALTYISYQNNQLNQLGKDDPTHGLEKDLMCLTLGPMLTPSHYDTKLLGFLKIVDFYSSWVKYYNEMEQMYVQVNSGIYNDIEVHFMDISGRPFNKKNLPSLKDGTMTIGLRVVKSVVY
jgi:hypothetical protein